MEKSRDATTVSNLRAAYAEAQAAYLTGASGGNATVTKGTNGAITSVAVSGVTAKGTKSGYNDLEKELPFTAPESMGGTTGTYTVTFSYDADGAISDVTASTT